MRYTILLSLVVAACIGCDPLAHPVSGRPWLSADTISFDTLFTGYRSATLELRVRNSGSEPLLIDHIWLGGGTSSPFTLNIDGVASASERSVTIARGDSIFIFIAVSADPSDSDLPLELTDSVNFASGSYRGRVILRAWGQDVKEAGGVITGNTIWDAGRPYMVKGDLLVESAASLTLPAGTRIFMQPGASLTVAGTLRSEGSADSPVVIATDRLEREYADIPGRWKGVSYLSSSRNNTLRHTEIRNAEIAVMVEGDPSSQPQLLLHSTKLIHNSVASLVARYADLFAVNSLFAHSGFSTVSLTGGGSYRFIHCTISNRWEYSYRSGPALFISHEDETMPLVTVTNSVVSGTRASELEIDAPASLVALSFSADSSLIKTDTLTAAWYTPSLFRDVITSLSPKFIDEAVWDFRPDTLSPLLDRAGRGAMALWPADIRGMPRPAGDGPDIGAYERQPGERRVTTTD